jgi:hypothetical protein
MGQHGLLSFIDEVIATGVPFVAHAMPVLMRPALDAAPEERYFNVVVQAIQEADGTRSRTFGHCVDVTDLVTAAREQQQLEAMSVNLGPQELAATKLRAALDQVATATARLAGEGNGNARLIVDQLRSRGVTINSPAASAPR